MTKFDQLDFTKFVADYSIKNGELVDEYSLNLSPQRLKKELNNTFNMVNILNGNRLLDWNPVETYLVGELCQNRTADDKYYRARKVSENKRPDLFPDLWEVAKNTDYTLYGDFTNFLAKDNTEPYSPAGQYNPATKGYVDFQDTKKLDLTAKAADSAKLNGEVVANVLSNSTSKPASVKLVQTVDNKVNTKLDSADFNATNVMAMVQNVDGAGSGLDADYLDGLSSEFYMKVGTTSNFDTMLTPGSYLISPGGVGAPDSVETYGLIVSGSGNYKSQIATSVTNNKLYYRSYVGSWSAWKEFASSTGNVATADKLSSPVTIGLSGDAHGSVSFDGSHNVSISVEVVDDSHKHDGRYYTKSASDGRFLGINDKAKDSTLFDGLNKNKFVRTDVDTMMNASYNITGSLTVAPGESNGIHFPNDSFGGRYDTASITLQEHSGGEATEMTLTMTNDADDIVHIKTQSNKGLKHNGYTVWTQGNDGSGSGLDADKLDGHNSDVNATANTVVVRDGGGGINGTSSSAKYADLAEIYTSKDNYSVGTLVQISTSDDYDIEENVNNIFGVISDKPGFILDKNIDGLPVAMVGKTPVRVIGKLNKGDKICAKGSVAIKANANDKIIGIALETKKDKKESLIRCFVQVQL
jgi:hypothetical protein